MNRVTQFKSFSVVASCRKSFDKIEIRYYIAETVTQLIENVTDIETSLINIQCKSIVQIEHIECEKKT